MQEQLEAVKGIASSFLKDSNDKSSFRKINNTTDIIHLWPLTMN